MRIDADIVIPGRGDPTTNGSVVVDGATIGYVGSAESAPGEALGHYPALMPGMWDCHAHYTGMVELDLEHDLKTNLATKAARATYDVTQTLMAGVTSVREPGGLGIFIRHAVNEGKLPGPYIFSAGRILTTTGGHADVHGFPIEWVVGQGGYGIGEICDGESGCLRGVRLQLRNGADLIKVCASGGVASEVDHPVHQQFSLAELEVIVEEAGRAERAVAAHCHGKPGIMAALEAGVKTIEHGSYLDEEAATAMVESGAILVPTRFIIEESLGMGDRWPSYAFRKMVMVAEHHENALKTAIARGVTIATGADVFFSGDVGRRRTGEVRCLIDAGMTPLGAIEAATANGPLTLGPRAPRSGILANGFDADLIAFDTNPLEDVTVWGDPDRVTHVWKGGELVKGS
jgi:imidazolonepropionase-like amidohydrolase